MQQPVPERGGLGDQRVEQLLPGSETADGQRLDAGAHVQAAPLTVEDVGKNVPGSERGTAAGKRPLAA